uniref:Uncharacterized protein n=1 Tax=Anguilla anguilla TaxID=7936 RepID=A0A0E9Q181_ANGAN
MVHQSLSRTPSTYQSYKHVIFYLN